MTTSLIRGIRNNNPLNIRESEGDHTQWVGEHDQDLDPSFEEFNDPIYGIRAGARILINYQSKYGLNTIRKIMDRYAPPVENDTNSYAQHIADKVGISQDQQIDVKDHLFTMIKTMIKHENGINPYSDDQIKQGIALV